MEGLPENLPDLGKTYPIFFLTKATKITRGLTTYDLKFPPGFMLHMDFPFFIVESICVFTSNVVVICYATSHPFVFPYRSKRSPLDILKCIVTTLMNQDKKVAFIWVDEYVTLAIYSIFIKTCKNMNIIVQTTGGDASYLNVKIKITNKKFDNITRALLLN